MHRKHFASIAVTMDLIVYPASEPADDAILAWLAAHAIEPLSPSLSPSLCVTSLSQPDASRQTEVSSLVRLCQRLFRPACAPFPFSGPPGSPLSLPPALYLPPEKTRTGRRPECFY